MTSLLDDYVRGKSPRYGWPKISPVVTGLVNYLLDMDLGESFMVEPLL